MKVISDTRVPLKDLGGKNMKKFLSVILALTLVLTMFVGCGSKETTTDTNTSTSTETTKPESKPEPKKEITVAAIETAYGTESWTKVAEAYEKLTGVHVNLIMDKNLEEAIGANMKAGEYPDVVHLATGRPAALTETMIKDNALTDLTPVLSMTVPGESKKVSEKIAGGFTESSLTNPYGDGKTYLAPMFYSPCGLFYNAGLFEAKGWEVPTTWDEMWALGDKAKEEGIALFCYPTAGYFDAFFYALSYSVGGPEFFDKVTHYEEGIWDTAEGEELLGIIAKLATYTEKSVPSNANNDNFQKNQQLILDNKALFMPNGTWVVGEMANAPRAEGFKWGLTALPATEKGGDRYSYTWFEQAWIPAAAENKDEAMNFIAYLYSDEAAKIFSSTETPAFQPVVGIADTLEGDNKLFYSIYDTGAKAAMGNFAATEAVEGVSVAEATFEAVNSLVSGNKTVEEYKAGIVKAFDALRPALKK